MGRLRKALIALVIIIVVFAAAVAWISYLINRTMIDRGVEYTATSQTSEKITINADEKARIKELDPECAIVLEHKLVPRLLLTGDNGQVQHNEIHVMLKYCLDAGVPPEDIFCDHAGFSTYESMYRADYIFNVKRAVVITQYYHLFRALWLADGFGIEALGAASDQQQPYPHQKYRNSRENLARVKDYFMVMAKPKPKYLGEPFPITGDDSIETHGE